MSDVVVGHLIGDEGEPTGLRVIHDEDGRLAVQQVLLEGFAERQRLLHDEREVRIFVHQVEAVRIEIEACWPDSPPGPVISAIGSAAQPARVGIQPCFIGLSKLVRDRANFARAGWQKQSEAEG